MFRFLSIKSKLPNSISKWNFTRNLNCNIASIAKVNRKLYIRTYPTRLVLSDGSSFNIKYFEPKQIITLPLDLTTLTEEERKLRIEKRKPKVKVKIEEFIDQELDVNKYINLVKN